MAGSGSFLFEIDVKLASNAKAFTEDIKRQMRELNSEAGKQPKTSAGTTSAIARTEGQALGRLQHLKETKKISPEDYKERVKAVREETEALRQQSTERLRAQGKIGKHAEVAAPQQSKILEQASKTYRSLNPDATKKQLDTASKQMETVHNGQLKAEKASLESLERKAKADKAAAVAAEKRAATAASRRVKKMGDLEDKARGMDHTRTKRLEKEAADKREKDAKAVTAAETKSASLRAKESARAAKAAEAQRVREETAANRPKSASEQKKFDDQKAGILKKLEADQNADELEYDKHRLKALKEGRQLPTRAQMQSQQGYPKGGRAIWPLRSDDELLSAGGAAPRSGGGGGLYGRLHAALAPGRTSEPPPTTAKKGHEPMPTGRHGTGYGPAVAAGMDVTPAEAGRFASARKNLMGSMGRAASALKDQPGGAIESAKAVRTSAHESKVHAETIRNASQQIQRSEGHKSIGVTAEDIDTAGHERAIAATRMDAEKTVASQMRTNNDYAVQQNAEKNLAHKEFMRSSQKREWEMAKETGMLKEGTMFQRAQAKSAQRQGGAVRLPGEFQTAKQFASSKVTSTLGYGLSAGVLYGGMSFGADILDEAGDLQQMLALVEDQFKATGDASQSVSFETYKQQLRDLSEETGVAVSITADMERQLAGAFSKEDGTPDHDRAVIEADAALKFSELTGLPIQEVTDSLTAMALAFDQSIEEIADSSIHLAQTFGVQEEDIVRFTADLAPLGKELGFSSEQLSGLGAAMQKSSGKSGQVLGEQAGRFLPGLQTGRMDVLRQFNEAGMTDVMDKLNKAYAQNDIPQVLRLIVEEFDNLGDSQKKTLVNNVAGERQAAAFYSVLEDGTATLRALNTEEGAGKGKLEDKWKGRVETVQYEMTQLRRKFEDFGLSLFEAGIGDALQFVIDKLGLIATAAVKVAGVFEGFNKVLGHLPSKLLAAIGLSKLFLGMWSKLKGIQLATFIQGKMAARAAGSGMGFSPMQAGFVGPQVMAPGTQFMSARNAETGAGGVMRTAPMISNYSQLTQSSQRAFDSRKLRWMMTDAETGKRFGRGAGTGGSVAAGKGTSFASGIAAMAPMAAVALSMVAIQQVQSYRSKVQGLADQIGEQTAQKLKDGLSPEKLRAQTAGLHETNPLIRGISRLTGKEAPVDMYKTAMDEETEKALSPKYQAQVKAIAGNEQDRMKLAELAYNEKQKKKDGFFNLSSKNTWDDLSVEQQQAQADDILPTLEKYMENPEDVKLSNYVTDLINASLLDPQSGTKALAAADAYEREKEESEDAAKTAEREAKKKVEFKMGVEEAHTAYDLSEIGFGDLIAVLHKERDFLKNALGGDPGSEEYMKGVEAIRAAEGDIRQTMEDEIERRYEREAGILGMGSGGQVDPIVALYQATKKYNEYAREGSGASDAQIYAAGKNMIDARDAHYQSLLDGADTAAERLKIMEEGPAPISQEQLDLMNRTKLGMGAPSTVVSALADNFQGTGVTATDKELDAIEQAKDYVLGLVAQYGESALAIARATLLAEKEMLLKTKEGLWINGSQVAAFDPSERIAEIDAGVAAIDAMPEGLGMDITNEGSKATPEELAKARKEAHLEDLANKRKTLKADYSILKAKERDKKGDIHLDIAELTKELSLVDPGDDDARKEIWAQIIEANNSLDEMIEDEAKAKASYMMAFLTDQGDVVGAAQIDINLANEEVRKAADGSREKWDALTHQVSANRAMREALLDVFVAQRELATALFESAGDAVGVAEEQLKISEEKYRSAAAAGVKGPELDRLQADVVRQQANLTTVVRNDAIGDLDYLAEFDKITIAQHIAGLKMQLETIPESNKDARREILRKIKALREEVGKDLAFNLPANLRLPTLYETRRLGQSGRAGYQDNRVVTITLNANNAIDGTAAVAAIVKAIDGPPLNGMSNKVY